MDTNKKSNTTSSKFKTYSCDNTEQPNKDIFAFLKEKSIAMSSMEIFEEMYESLDSFSNDEQFPSTCKQLNSDIYVLPPPNKTEYSLTQIINELTNDQLTFVYEEYI